MDNVSRNEQCCGCKACYGVCPTNAISYEEDKKGFPKPRVNDDLCIHCSKCIGVCPTILNKGEKRTPIKVMAIKKKEDLKSSQSGGAFAAISDYILGKEGVVYGVVLDDKLHIRYSRAEDFTERNKMKKSKYVYSEMDEELWKKLEKDLVEHRYVLFAGTPCQCAAVLKRFIKYRESLFLVDIVCHGVASPRVWKDYVDEISEKGKIYDFIFRDNEKFGWHSNKSTIIYENGKKKSNREFASLYYSDYCMNESCYHCEYARTERVGDISIGDFWGIEKIDSTLKDDNEGISLCLLNTHEGVMLFEEIQNQVWHRNYTKYEWAQQYNLHRPTPKPKNLNDFWDDYDKKSIVSIRKKYGEFSLIRTLHIVLKNFFNRKNA